MGAACPEPEHSYLLPSGQQVKGISPVAAWVLLHASHFVRHNLSLVCLVRITYVYIDTVFGFYGYFFFVYLFFFYYPSLLLSWMLEHDCLDICCFGCLICMCCVFLHLRLFHAIEHVSHGKEL